MAIGLTVAGEQNFALPARSRRLLLQRHQPLAIVCSQRAASRQRCGQGACHQPAATAACLPGCLSAGLAMFISGMVLWRTEGSHALIGLWVLGLLVFIPGFYFT